MKNVNVYPLLVFILMICDTSSTLFAQETAAEVLEQKLEQSAEVLQNEEIDFLETEEELEYYKKHPINLNHASRQELVRLHLLSTIQINNLISHIDKTGKLLELYELQSIAGFDLNTIYSLLPLVGVSEIEQENLSIRKIIKGGNHSLFIGTQQVLEGMKGYITRDSPNSIYAGSKQKLNVKYKFSYNKNISAGVLAEKDAGEVFFKKNIRFANTEIPNELKSGFDFYSAHLFLSGIKFIKALALGDYRIDFGQGLTASNLFSFGKSADAISIQRMASGIRPHSSYNENLFMRGIAFTIGNKKLNTSVFVSGKKIDANSTDSSSKPFLFSSFQTSGLHATVAELEDKNSLTQTVVGSNVSFTEKKYSISISGTHTLFDSEIQKPVKSYNYFQFSGKEISNAGIDYSLNWRNLNFFGESSLSSLPGKKTGYATITGCILSLDSKVALSLLYRNFSKEYQNLFSNAFAQNFPPNNEQGMYMGISISPVKKISINAYYDFYSSHWLRYNTNAPSQGSEYLFQIKYAANKNFETYFQVNHSEKQVNADTPSPIDFISSYRRANYKWNLSYKISPGLSLHNRIQFSSITKTDSSKENGFLISQDIAWKPSFKINKKRINNLSIALRYAIFETPSFESRIYIYESDMPGVFSIPSYYYSGSRVYVMLTCNLIPHIQLLIRYSQTYYSDRNVISKGTLNEINGNKKSEIKIAVRANF